MSMRLRRAYAEAEDLRAQLLQSGGMGGPSSQDGIEETQKLRLELGRALERANAAESRASRLSGELQEARVAAGLPIDAPPTEPLLSADGLDEDEKSLRFRLARSASKKKGTDPDNQWS